MIVAGVSGLIEDIGVSFGLPLFFLCLALVNIRVSSRRKYAGLKLRVSLVFSIGLFGYLISSLMLQDRFVLASIWKGSPALYSLLYVVGAVLVLVGIAGLAYWKLRPSLWRQNDSEPEGCCPK
jgi:hypothetical protein